MDDSKTAHSALDLLIGYLARGWALVPLHDVSAGHCSCRAGAQCGSAGKHPRYQAWQEESQLIRDVATLQAVYDAHPEWNWGVATGAPSGIWVLDWDVDHNAEIFAWVADVARNLGRAWGNEFDTLTLGPTGGGGKHFVFELPPWGVPRGSQTRNRYGLPPGLDVRGWHGQIVVAPSVSGKGPYGGVLIDAPVRRAPVWLEETIRPPADTPAVKKPQDLYSVLAQPVGPDARALAYARAAVAAELQRLAIAPEGTRNDTAFQVACRLHEIANAPWSGYSEETLLGAWWDSRWWHEVGRDSADGVWRRARDKVAGAAAILPPDYAGSEHIPILDFPLPGAGLSPGGLRTDELLFLDPVIGGQPPAAEIDLVQQLIDKMLTPEQIRALPKPEPLIQGLLDLNTTAWLIGRPKSGKSFVALDFAAHVGLGIAWQGRRVKQGRVVYIVAEGSQGIGLRLEAWEREYGHMKDLLVLPEPVPANERTGKYGQTAAGRWTVLVEACRKLAPALVIIDTQARVTAGLKENDNDDMSYYAAQADRIKDACGACVLTVHHIGRSGTDARGASAIDGAQDAELRVERASDDAMMLTVHVDAQKDMAAGKPLTIALRRSDGGVDPETGRDLSSLVLVQHEQSLFQDPEVPAEPEWRMHARELYRILLDYTIGGPHGSPPGVSKPDANKMLKARVLGHKRPGAQTTACTKAWATLVSLGLVLKRSHEAMFKVAIVFDQGADGVLTPWSGEPDKADFPAGWNRYTGDDESPEDRTRKLSAR